MVALWEKLQFWKKQKMFEENIDYVFVDIQDADVNAIRLLRGKYKDVVYCYGAASVNEECGLARLKFDYIIVDPGTYVLDDLTNDEEFHTMIGDMLVEMITVQGQNEQTRNNDSEESYLQ
jgi:hypothetical protein